MINTSHLDSSSTKAIIQPEKVNKTIVIAVKILSAVAIAAGIALAITGSVVLIKIAITYELFGGAVALGLLLAIGLLKISGILAANPITALGLTFTLPAAAAAAGGALLIPIVLGALPGVGVILLGVAGLSWDPNKKS